MKRISENPFLLKKIHPFIYIAALRSRYMGIRKRGLAGDLPDIKQES
jgi:hypothetical protein